MFKKVSFLVLALCLLVGAQVFMGCDPTGGDDPPPAVVGNISPFIGYWDSGAGDGFIITNTTLEYYGYSSTSYTSKVKYVINFDDTSGVIIVEYTTPPVGYSYTPTDNFFGIYYRERTAGSIKLANAYTVANASTPVETATLAQALTKFTRDDVDLFVGGWTFSAYVKQPSPTIDPGSLKGNWTDSSSTWVSINNTSFGYYIGYIDPDNVNLGGTIVEITDASQSSGYIYIQITEASAMGDWSDCEAGHYYAIHWKNKTGNAVDICTAYKYGGEDDKDTLAGAKEEFTVAKGYFDDGFYESLTKQ
jgi:hypothetical protein